MKKLYNPLILKPGVAALSSVRKVVSNAMAHHGVLDERIDFLQKPFSINAFLEMARVVLDRA